ncbi:hypothetical protein [Streptomyces sp.]|uniref:hypothetical protein n=1 Tax=Streptomyces sp. TaxID=1931 RepID=UPI002D7583FD|nr:hypothetical protein [Streptomyces sp.]HZF90031.1 hypothetical protein [Streptomyces sp.]
MTAPAELLLPALSKRTAQRTADLPHAPGADPRVQPHPCAFSAEGSCAQAPLTSEPPLPDAEPLTSEPPLAAPDADSTRP